MAGAIVGADGGCELARAEVTDSGHELLLVRRERKVEHRYGFFDGVGVRLGVGLGDVVGLGVGDGAGVTAGFRSLGPTLPMTGRRLPMPRMIGTLLEPCSWGERKPVYICCS